MKIEKNVVQVQKTWIEIIHHLIELLLSPTTVFHHSSFCMLYFLSTDFVSCSCSLFRDGVWSMQIRSADA